MKVSNIFRVFRSNKNLPISVIFAGGMGTQLIQAAVYFSLRDAGHSVFADLSYFETEAKIAEVGKAGELTHWFWQLEQFGLPRTSFEQCPNLNKRNSHLLSDGPKMLEMGLAALAKPSIQSRFKNTTAIADILPKAVLSCFLCLHIRRGDYVNVANHLISDGDFINLVRKFSGLINHAVILSDSPIPPEFRITVSHFFKTVTFLDDIDPYSSHQIMRRARILICSNSTFSLTAAALNSDALIIIPKQWFGKQDSDLEAPIQSLCGFQIVK
jgi:hypothetical protein